MVTAIFGTYPRLVTTDRYNTHARYKYLLNIVPKEGQHFHHSGMGEGLHSRSRSEARSWFIKSNMAIHPCTSNEELNPSNLYSHSLIPQCLSTPTVRLPVQSCPRISCIHPGDPPHCHSTTQLLTHLACKVTVMSRTRCSCAEVYACVCVDAYQHVCIARLDVYVVEKVDPHVVMVALWVLRIQPYIPAHPVVHHASMQGAIARTLHSLIHVEGDDMLEAELPGTMHRHQSLHSRQGYRHTAGSIVFRIASTWYISNGDVPVHSPRTKGRS